jgi:hypothetical protein
VYRSFPQKGTNGGKQRLAVSLFQQIRFFPGVIALTEADSSVHLIGADCLAAAPDNQRGEFLIVKRLGVGPAAQGGHYSVPIHNPSI